MIGSTQLGHADRLITAGHLSHALEIILVYYRARLRGMDEPSTSRLSSSHPRGDAFVTFLTDRIVSKMREKEHNSNKGNKQ